MALEVKFSVKEGVNSVFATFLDLTGDSPNPITGFGGANIPRSAIGSATLTIYFPSPTLPDTSSTNYSVIDLFARGYPLTTSITLLPADFSQPTTIPDGIYLFRLSASGTTDPPTELFSVDWYGFFYRSTECCLDKMLGRLCGCDECLTDKDKKMLRGRLDFYALSLNETYCQDIDAASITLQHAMNICANGCKPCNHCGS